MSVRFYIFMGILLGSFPVLSAFSQTIPADEDSTFWFLSLPEIQNYRAYYLQELEALQEEGVV